MTRRSRLAVCLGAFIVATAFVFNIAFAGTVGNPSSMSNFKGAGAFSLKQNKNLNIGASADLEFIFDRDIRAQAATETAIESGQWYMAGMSCTFLNRISPYVKLGVAHMKAKWTEVGKKATLESDTNLAWGAGGKVLIWEFARPKVKFVADGYYRAADLDAEKGTYNGGTVTLDPAKSRFTIREWQFALLAATEIDLGTQDNEALGVSKIAPYAGVTYSDISGRLRQTISDGDYHNPGKIESDKNVGVFGGFDFIGPNDSVALSIEGRFIDETALTAGLSVLF